MIEYDRDRFLLASRHKPHFIKVTRKVSDGQIVDNNIEVILDDTMDTPIRV